jgi:hypothetical protein
MKQMLDRFPASSPRSIRANATLRGRSGMRLMRFGASIRLCRREGTNRGSARPVQSKKGAAFSLEEFHNDLLSHGTVPVSIIASEMLAQ